MRLLTILVAGLLAGPLLAAPVPKKRAKDEDAILGGWKLEQIGVSATDPSAEAVAKVRLKFTDDGKLVIRDSLSERETTFKLNSAARLKEIDIIEEGGLTAGVYELDGDTLRIALPCRGDTTRPTELKVDCGGAIMVLTLKRIKDE